MHRGYIKLWRRLRDSDLWLKEPFTRGQAWVDLLMLANYQDGAFRSHGKLVKIRRGQCGWSEVALSARWHWSRGKVRRFLAEMSSETVQQIEQQKSRLTSLITIKNYDLYQSDGTTNGTELSTSLGTSLEHDSVHREEELRRIKKKRNKETPSGVELLPEWIDKEVWESFLELRRRIRAPLTDRAKRNILRQLSEYKDQGQDPNAVLDQSITRGWRGVFPLKAERRDANDFPGFDWSDSHEQKP
jgi:hypothetical protein